MNDSSKKIIVSTEFPSSVVKAIDSINSLGVSSSAWDFYSFVDLPVATLLLLWQLFRDIPVNENDEIEERFLCFDVGTHREYVWHWFECMNPNFVIGTAALGNTSQI